MQGFERLQSSVLELKGSQAGLWQKVSHHAIELPSRDQVTSAVCTQISLL